jgi:arylsulfatase A-like enzyme
MITRYLICGLLALASPGWIAAAENKPNIVIIFTDDMGYGDLGCFGHPTIRTPNLDRMADEGMRFTQFYSASGLCSPSRAALLTGRYPPRAGVPDVFWPEADTRHEPGGLPAGEITIAEALKSRGYATALIGKWHLGDRPQYAPARQGFDYFYGLPYSNDMDRAEYGHPPVPLLRGETVIESPVEQSTLTRRMTGEALAFIEEHREGPFFLYLAHIFPHKPLHASPAFRGRSLAGIYGDAVEEIDWSTGEILGKLRELGLDRRTLVFFTSDNGPRVGQPYEDPSGRPHEDPRSMGGSPGPLRGGKNTTWEGGMRMPAIAWWPGTIPSGRVCMSLASTLDLFPTSVSLAGGEPPADRIIDGIDLSPLLRGESDQGRETMFYYKSTTLEAMRRGPWKLRMVSNPPALYNVEVDPSEKFNYAAQYPEIVDQLWALAERHLARFPDH